MFSRRRSFFDFSRGRLAKGPRRVKCRGDGRGVKLGVEQLEDRRLLAADLDTSLTLFEPHVAVNPVDPSNIVASQFNQIVISVDYGETFSAPVNATLPAALQGAGYGFGGDSVLAFDATGTTLHWSYLGTIDTDGDGNNEDQTVIVQRVNPFTGAQIGNSVDLSPGNFADDKQWITVDDNPQSPFAGNIYVAWPRLNGNPDQLLFSRSTDGGVTYSAPALISDPDGPNNILDGGGDDEEFVWPSHVETAPNGDLYVAYHIDAAPNGAGDNPNGGPIVVLRSSNGGADFAGGTVNQKSTAFPAGTSQINDNTQTDATLIAQTDFWTLGAFAPYLMADPLQPGRIYIIGNDDPNDLFGNGDEGDVVFAFSEDNGLTWSAPTTISHAPAGTLQVFPTATIDELGNIAVFWYDTRAGLTNAGGNLLLDVYATVSRDGGQTFSNDFRVNDLRFDPDLNAPTRFNGPPATTRIGEYNGIAASEGVVHLVWTGNDQANNQQEVFYDQFNILGPFADPWEENDSQATASILGSLPKITLKDATLDNPQDVDFFKYTAAETGKLVVNSFFHDGVADLRLRVLDSLGNVILDGTQFEVLPGLDTEELVIPVVSQEEYWIEVSYDPSEVIHNPLVYDLEIENFAAPAPAFVDLVSSSDTGLSNVDNVTSDTTPTFLIQADLVDFRDMGIDLLNANVIDPNGDGDAADATNDGAGVYVSLIDLATGIVLDGFADQLGPSGFLWTFTVPALAALADADYFVSSAVQIVDGQQDPNRENGRAQLSDPLFISILGGGAGANVSADLLNSSDTGMFNNDNVTNKMSPAIQGIAPAGSTVRLFANGELVGQTTTGSDSSDDIIGPIGGIGGEPDDGLGLWEITTEPLADGAYDLRVEVEDAAGNVTAFNVDLDNDDATAVDIVVDTLEPNTPFLDLRDDTGEDLHDEITNDTTPEVFMTTTDPNIALAQQLFTDNLKFRIFDRFEANAETLIYDSAADAAADNVTTPGDMFTSLNALTRTLNLADGTHNLKLEVEDRAGNISHDFLLEVVVDSLAPVAPTPNLLDSSDSGMFNDDNVTSKMQPAFDSTAEVNTKVTVYAQAVDPATGLVVGTPQLVGSGTVGSDATDGTLGNGLGLWEVTVEPLVDGAWDITTRLEDWAGNLSTPSEALRIVVDTEAPNTPLLDLLDDTGRSDVDNITKDNQPQVLMTSTDPNVQFSEVLFTDNFKFRIFDRFEATAEILIYDSAADALADNVTTAGDMFTSLTALTKTLPSAIGTLTDGVHNLKLEVEDRAGNISHDFLLEIIVDTVTPPVAFGLPDAASLVDGLAAESDSGVTTMPATFADRITSDTTPRLWGRAEADTIVRVYHDRDADGVIDLLTDDFLGQTVATPFNGNDAYPDGYWEITSALDLNQIFGIPKDGLRRLLVTAEDVAGNPMPMANQIADGVDALNIFIDTQGPQVYDPAGATQAVHPTIDPTYDLFDPKPSENGFSPLINQITINVRDLPLRSNVDPNFLYDALKADVAAVVGNYSLVGDHVGTIGIIDVQVVNAVVVNNQQATATVTLTFADFLPDDRFTLTVSDNLVDPAGNNLDGESNANGPLDDPTFPSGDGVPGGDFVARFTVDSRPEIGSFVAQNIDIDINGNFVWDPANGQIGNDATNVDLTFRMGVADPVTGAIIAGGYGVHDLVFAGKFTNGAVPTSGRLFDQLAVFGWETDLFGQPLGKRWLVDTNSDGVINTSEGDIFNNQPLLAFFDVGASIPIAGNFDGNAANGDEIGLYNAGQWALDSNRNFVIDAGDTFVTGNLLGRPIVGDFDGNGEDDLGVFNNNTFNFDMNVAGFDGNSDRTMVWGFPGVLDRPVATDMNQDGIDDIGLWVPRNSAQSNRPIAEWYFLISDAALQADGTINAINHPFEPVPFGNDLYAEFGDELALPIVGNFDPPVVAEDPTTQNETETGDFDQDGDVDGSDFLAFQRGFGMSGQPSMSDGDGNSDGVVDHYDMELWASAFQASATVTSDFNGDGSVDGDDLVSWSANFGTVSSTGEAGDANGDGNVDGADFLRWQRSYQSSTASSTSALSASSALSAPVTSPPPAVAAVASATPSLFELLDLSGITGESLSPAAIEAAFDTLEEEFVLELVEDNKQFSAATSESPLSAPAPSTSATEVEIATSEAAQQASDAWERAFSEDDFVLSGLL